MFKRSFIISFALAASVLSMSCVIRADTEDQKVPHKDFGFSYSPDGARAVFYTYRDGKLPDIYERSHHSHDRNLTNRTDTWDIEPDFSPDGKSIIYSSGVDMASLSLRIMDADGSNDRLFFDGDDNEVAANWSPDGTMVMFSAFNNNERNNIIYLTDPSGQHAKPLTADLPGQSSNASWSLDSRSIVFSNRPDEHTQRDLYIMRADGTGLKRLTNTAMSETAPIILPDGENIVFVGQNGEEGMQLYIMPIDGLKIGQQPTQISHFNQTLLYFLSLKPGGKEITFSMGDWTNGFSLSSIPVPSTDAPKH